jgi:hypothetical protein
MNPSVSAFETELAGLRGATLVRVRYFEIDYENGQPEWRWDDRFDSLDFGLELTLDDGRTFNLTWGNEFQPYGVSYARPVLDTATHTQVWDVTNSSR